MEAIRQKLPKQRKFKKVQPKPKTKKERHLDRKQMKRETKLNERRELASKKFWAIWGNNSFDPLYVTGRDCSDIETYKTHPEQKSLKQLVKIYDETQENAKKLEYSKKIANVSNDELRQNILFLYDTGNINILYLIYEFVIGRKLNKSSWTTIKNPESLKNFYVRKEMIQRMNNSLDTIDFKVPSAICMTSDEVKELYKTGEILCYKTKEVLENKNMVKDISETVSGIIKKKEKKRKRKSSKINRKNYMLIQHIKEKDWEELHKFIKKDLTLSRNIVKDSFRMENPTPYIKIILWICEGYKFDKDKENSWKVDVEKYFSGKECLSFCSDFYPCQTHFCCDCGSECKDCGKNKNYISGYYNKNLDNYLCSYESNIISYLEPLKMCGRKRIRYFEEINNAYNRFLRTNKYPWENESNSDICPEDIRIYRKLWYEY